MGFAVTSLILAICIIFHCVNSEKVEVETIPGPTPIASNVMVQTASYMIQKITSSISNVGQLYYFGNKSELLIPNREKNGSIYVYFDNNGTTNKYYFKELSEETITTITPIAGTLDEFIITSDLNLRICKKNNTDYSISEPVMTINEPGYIIHAAHCDSNGTMIILLVGNSAANRHLGKFYRIKDQKAELMMKLYNYPKDFRFNSENTDMYVIHYFGKIITSFGYDTNSGEVGVARYTFDLRYYEKYENMIMRSIVLDKISKNMWVTVAGSEGFVFQINLGSKELTSVTTLPTKDLTFITFGFTSYKSLYVGSKTTCVTGPAEGSIYALSGMGIEGTPDNPIKWY